MPRPLHEAINHLLGDLATFQRPHHVHADRRQLLQLVGGRASSLLPQEIGSFQPALWSAECHCDALSGRAICTRDGRSLVLKWQCKVCTGVIEYRKEKYIQHPHCCEVHMNLKLWGD